MTNEPDFERVSIYVPKRFQHQEPFKRLYRLGEKDHRSLNYMIIKVVMEYVERHEKHAQNQQE